MATRKRFAPNAAVLAMACLDVYWGYHWMPWLLMPCRTMACPVSLQSWVPFTCNQPFFVTPPRSVVVGCSGSGVGFGSGVMVAPPRSFSARWIRAQASARVRLPLGWKFPFSSPWATPQA